MLKSLLARAQKKMRNRLLETEGKGFLLHGRKLAELCPTVMWEANVNDELGYVGEEVSKQCF